MSDGAAQHQLPTLSVARPSRLRQRLKAGGIAVGCLLSYDAPWLVEVLGMTGYDFVTIDLEHEPIDVGSVATLVRTADLVGMTSIVRMHASEAIFPMLSAGAQGVWIPDLRGRAHAEQIVELTRFAPVGRRTYYTQTRAAQYGIGIDEREWTGRADAELLVVAMIEDIAVVDELDEILAVPGIDGFHVGTLDLAQSMGSPSPERVDDVVAQVLGRCRSAGRLCSVGVVTPWSLDSVQKRVDQGVQIFNVASAWLLTHAVGSFLEQVEHRIPDSRRATSARLPSPNQYIKPGR
jgi:2-keto-3-deoxy-L-rhamnonate aldolase RhmA